MAKVVCVWCGVPRPQEVAAPPPTSCPSCKKIFAKWELGASFCSGCAKPLQKGKKVHFAEDVDVDAEGDSEGGSDQGEGGSVGGDGGDGGNGGGADAAKSDVDAEMPTPKKSKKNQKAQDAGKDQGPKITEVCNCARGRWRPM